MELFVTFALLFPALMLLGLAFTGKPWAGLFSGMLLLIFGVMLLGTGFQYGNGLNTNSTGYVQYINTSIIYQNVTSNASTFSILGVFQSSVVTTQSVPVSENTSIVNTGNRTSVSNYNSQKDTLTDGTSVLFIFLGLAVMALALLIMGKNKDVYNFKINQNERED